MNITVDFGYYSQTYGGRVLTGDTFRNAIRRASIYLEQATHGREPKNEARYISRCKDCLCELAEAFGQITMAQDSARLAVDGSDKTAGGKAKSISSGSESITYDYGGGNPASQSVYVKAGGDIKTANEALSRITALYLGDVPSADGINLLYGGMR